MPKPFSRRFDAALAAYKPKDVAGSSSLNWMDPLHTVHSGSGSAKPGQAAVAPTPSVYANTNSTSFNGPFGSATSGFGAIDPKTGKQSIDTNMSLSAPLQQAGQTASTGLGNNLAYINSDPAQQVNRLTSGQDPTYNILNEQAQRGYNTNLGSTRLAAQNAGASNSTAAGAAYGKLMSDKSLVDNQNLLAGLNYGNQTATQNANTNLGAIGNLAQLTYPLGSAANAQLNTAAQGTDRANALTAQSQNTSNNNYTAANNLYNQQQQAGMGGGIGSLVGTLGGAALGSAMGPAGTMAGAQIGGAIGGKLGGGSSGGVYVPQQFGSNFGALNPGYTNPFGAGSGLGAMFNTSGINGQLGNFGAIDPTIMAVA